MSASARAPDPDAPPEWHSLAMDAALQRLTVDRQTGLNSDEVSQRLAKYGANSLPESKRRGPWLRFALQFHNPLIYVLLAAGVVTFGLKDYVVAGVIAGVVLINALIGFIQQAALTGESVPVEKALRRWL